MKRALFCFMVISLFLCLGGYGQATQFMDHVSLTVQGIDIEEGFTDLGNKDDWVGKKLNMFMVIYNDESIESHAWDNDTGEEVDTFGPDWYMTFLSDATYELDDDFLSLLDFFNFVQPSYPHVRQVYGHEILVPGKTIVYDYVFRPGLSGFLFDYTGSENLATGSVTINDGQGNRATIWFGFPYDIQRIGNDCEINSGVTIGDNVTLEEEVVINRNSTVGSNVYVGAGTIINQDVDLGDDVVVESDVTIDKGTTIGIGVKIGTGTVIGKDCIIEDDVIIGERVVIGRDVTVFAGAAIPDGTVIGKESEITPLP